MTLSSADSCSNSEFRTYNSKKSTLGNMREHWRISKVLQHEVPQATKPYVHLQINQLELQVWKEEGKEEEEKEE